MNLCALLSASLRGVVATAHNSNNLIDGEAAVFIVRSRGHTFRFIEQTEKKLRRVMRANITIN